MYNNKKTNDFNNIAFYENLSKEAKLDCYKRYRKDVRRGVNEKKAKELNY